MRYSLLVVCKNEPIQITMPNTIKWFCVMPYPVKGPITWGVTITTTDLATYRADLEFIRALPFVMSVKQI